LSVETRAYAATRRLVGVSIGVAVNLLIVAGIFVIFGKFLPPSHFLCPDAHFDPV
jgi:hypothetical protein